MSGGMAFFQSSTDDSWGTKSGGIRSLQIKLAQPLGTLCTLSQDFYKVTWNSLYIKKNIFIDSLRPLCTLISDFLFAVFLFLLSAGMLGLLETEAFCLAADLVDVFCGTLLLNSSLSKLCVKSGNPSEILNSGASESTSCNV